jgi:hypothetical protein
MESKLLSVLEEQQSVQFTGKVNVLATFNRQFLGHVLFKSGDIIQVLFQGNFGLKALGKILVQEHALEAFEYVVEPEIVEEKERQIHLPFPLLKTRMADVLRLHQSALKLRPPENIKIVLDGEFLQDSLPVSAEEFDVLTTLTEWNNPYDLYQHCPLLDHEITLSLVSLRKKGALKILSVRE